MGIIRHHGNPADHFTIVPNALLRDERLNHGARALMALLMSHRDGFEVSVRHLAEQSPTEGRDRVRGWLAELETFNYLRRGRHRDEHGRLGAADYDLYPHADAPVDKPPTYDDTLDLGAEQGKHGKRAGQTKDGSANVGEADPKKTTYLEDQEDETLGPVPLERSTMLGLSEQTGRDIDYDDIFKRP